MDLLETTAMVSQALRDLDGGFLAIGTVTVEQLENYGNLFGRVFAHLEGTL